MRKSNSKETRRAVEAYVLEELENRRDNYDDPDTMRPVSWAFGILKDEMNYQSSYNGNTAIVGAGLAAKYRSAGRSGFVAATPPYWVWYLAVNAGCFACNYYDMRQLVAQWMDETPEEADAYSNDAVMAQYRYMTAQAFERLYERENTPYRIPTPVFKSKLQELRPESVFFDRDTMRHYHQTMKDISVEGFYIVTDDHGRRRDCYRVESRQRTDYDEERTTRVYYFDRVTMQQVHPATAEEA